MGVTIDKSRGNTIAECVSIKTVTEGGAAALATSPRGVGLKLGKIHNQMSLVGQLIGFVKMCRDLDMEIKQRISIREKRKEKLTSLAWEADV